MRSTLLAALIVAATSTSAIADTSFGQYDVADLPTDEATAEVECLALNLYYEARGDNAAGIYAVADVTMNRVVDPRYPNTVCDVVKQGSLRDGNIYTYRKDPETGEVKQYPSCQFSWYCDGKSDDPYNEELYSKMTDMAFKALYFNQFRGITEGATHYHATYVSPKWTKDLKPIGRIGAHVFYRWDYEGPGS